MSLRADPTDLVTLKSLKPPRPLMATGPPSEPGLFVFVDHITLSIWFEWIIPDARCLRCKGLGSGICYSLNICYPVSWIACFNTPSCLEQMVCFY